MIDTTQSSSTEDSRSILDKVLEDLKTRDEWLRRQATWYQMRHDGLRRPNKPWPSAADLHFPLADSMIERLKPFYFNQLFATDTMAQFIATDPSLNGVTSELAYWFDWKLKQESNIETEILSSIDMMLMAGFDVVQVRWQTDRVNYATEAQIESTVSDVTGAPSQPKSAGKLVFDAIDPSRVIVPEWTRDLQDADRVTLVKTISVEQYKRDERWPDRSQEFIDRIKGNGKSDSGLNGENTQLDQLKQRREGLTDSTTDNEILYWEVWENTSDGWLIHWISPLDSDLELRPSMRNPFKHEMLPMVRFDFEIKDTAHYSSRGVCERIGAFELSVNKLWNEKTDYMTLCNRPLFTSDQPVPNASNFKMTPGQIVPGGLSAVQMPQPPMSFDEEMQQQRSAAELLIGMPDFGLGENNNIDQKRTATEVNKIGALANISVDLKARMFRKALSGLYKMAFSTLLQYDKGGQFIVGNQVQSVPPQVIAQLQANPDGICIQPNGSGDSWNKQAQLQKAVTRKQMFAQSPWINQPELDKSILELDDPRLIDRLFQDPQQKQQEEYVDEAESVPALMLGFPIPVLPQQDHAARIKCLADFMHQRASINAHPDPVAMNAVAGHLQQHLQVLAQQNPKLAKQVAQSLQAQASPQVLHPNFGAPVHGAGGDPRTGYSVGLPDETGGAPIMPQGGAA